VLGRPGDVGDNAIRANAELVVRQLKASEPILEEDVNQGRLRIVGAYYSLASGAVSIIG